jgi:hypothetical protein
MLDDVKHTSVSGVSRPVLMRVRDTSRQLAFIRRKNKKQKPAAPVETE